MIRDTLVDTMLSVCSSVFLYGTLRGLPGFGNMMKWRLLENVLDFCGCSLAFQTFSQKNQGYY